MVRKSRVQGDGVEKFGMSYESMVDITMVGLIGPHCEGKGGERRCQT
jgi:hypothetical protein